MPDLYNRPRWTLPYLWRQLRDRAPLMALVFAGTFLLAGLGGVSTAHLPAPQARAVRALKAPADQAWRLRVPALLARPGARLAEASQLVPAGSAPGAPAAPDLARRPPDGRFEFGALVAASLALAYAVTATVRLLLAVGFREGMALRVGALLVLATSLLGAAWRFGPLAYLTAACAGALSAAWDLRVRPGRGPAARLGAWCLVGCLVDQSFAFTLPALVLGALTPETPRRSTWVGLTLVASLAILAVHVHSLLDPAARALALSQLGVGPALRRVLAVTVGTGASLFALAPLALLALPGLPRASTYDRNLGWLAGGVTLAWMAAAVLVARDPSELVGSPLRLAPALPALAPLIAFGWVRLREARRGGAGIAALALLGGAGLGLHASFDPEEPLRRLRHETAYFGGRGGPTPLPLAREAAPLDRSFAPELSDPALSWTSMVAWLEAEDGEPVLWLRPQGLSETLTLVLDGAGLTPRPWWVRTILWQPADGHDVPVLGSRSHGQRLLGASLALLAWLGVALVAVVLVVRARRAARRWDAGYAPRGRGRTP